MLKKSKRSIICGIIICTSFVFGMIFYVDSVQAQGDWFVCKCQDKNHYTSYRDRSVCLKVCPSYCQAPGINSTPEDLATNCQSGHEGDSEDEGEFRCVCESGNYQSFRYQETCDVACPVYCSALGTREAAFSCGKAADLPCGGRPGDICNPVGVNTVAEMIGKIIRGVLGVIGSIALLMFVWAGFMWMTARGNKEQVKKSQHMMAWAALGLAIIFASYLILQFIFNCFVLKTGCTL